MSIFKPSLLLRFRGAADTGEQVIAKMDASVCKIRLILMPYEDRARAFGGLQKRTQKIRLPPDFMLWWKRR